MMLFARLEALVLPASWLYGMGRYSARKIMRHAGGIRDGVKANGRRLLGPETSDDELHAFGVRVLTNFSKFFVKLLRSPKDYPTSERLLETMQGREHGEHVLGLGRGAICVTLHLGNYELGTLLAERFQPAAVVYRPDPYHLVEKLRSRTRDLVEVGEITTDRPMFGVQVLDLLRRGGSAFVAGDIGFEGEAVGAEFPFLDGRARFHDWPARLSIASGAPILPCFVPFEGEDAEERIHLEEPILPEDAGDADEIMRRLVAVFERYVRRYPDQWLILHDYWVE